MKESFSVYAVWWLEGDKKKFFGELKFSVKDGIALNLKGAFLEDGCKITEDFNFSGFKNIYGVSLTSEVDEYYLIKDWKYTSITFDGSRSAITGGYLFKSKSPIGESDIIAKRIFVELQYLKDFFKEDKLSLDPNQEKDLDRKIHSSSKFTLFTNVHLHHKWSHSSSKTITQHNNLRLDYKKNLPFEQEFVDTIIPLRNFFSFIYGFDLWIQNLGITDLQGEAIEVFIKQENFQEHDRLSIISIKRLENFEDAIENYLKGKVDWLIEQLWVTNIYGIQNSSKESLFLNYLFAIEIFYNRKNLYDDTLKVQHKTLTRILKQLTDPKEMSFLKDNIKLRKFDIGLKPKMEELFNKYPLLNTLITDQAVFIKECVAARHTFVHGSLKSQKLLPDKLDFISDYNNTLKTILRILILSELGLDDNQISLICMLR
jgi:hypothetical protein